MPIYSYLCNNGHEYELWEHLGASTTRRCEECAARSHRIMSRTNANMDVPATASAFKDSRRESDYDRRLANAFPMKFAIQEANKAIKK